MRKLKEGILDSIIAVAVFLYGAATASPGFYFFGISPKDPPPKSLKQLEEENGGPLLFPRKEDVWDEILTEGSAFEEEWQEYFPA